MCVFECECRLLGKIRHGNLRSSKRELTERESLNPRAKLASDEKFFARHAYLKASRERERRKRKIKSLAVERGGGGSTTIEKFLFARY